ESIYTQYKGIREKKENYDQLIKDSGGVAALVEENAGKAGIQNSKVYNRERETNMQNKFKKITAEVKFEGVNIKSALDFIYYMENSGKFIKTSSLRINQAVKERNSYDMTISFDSYSGGQP
ncbi:MAG: hypothetical protein LBT84_01525, partial [Spirochaetia bacterium]|nr:hypothetical protein [Spirochaetia bacterium]